MGRHKTPTAEKIFKGTYKNCKHGNSTDIAVAPFLKPPKSLEPPENIIDPFCQEHYRKHIQLLRNLKILTISDLPELNIMYATLQQYKAIEEKLKTLDPIMNSKAYSELTRLSMKLFRQYSNIAHNYFISPVARNKIQLDILGIGEKIEKHQQSLIGRLVSGKEN